jgi:hypothetical protein
MYRSINHQIVLYIACIMASFFPIISPIEKAYSMDLTEKMVSPRLVCYSAKDVSIFLRRLGYNSFSKAINSPYALERNSDGTALRILDWYNGKGLVIECNGSIDEFDIPGDRAWFNDENRAVAWLTNGKVYFINGAIEDPPFKANGADPGGKYFAKGEGVVKIYAINKPKMPLAEVNLLGSGVLRVFTKEDKLYIFDCRPENKCIEGYIFKIKASSLQKIKKIDIPYPSNKTGRPFVLDLSPWSDLVLICERFDWPSRSKFYEFNLATQQMTKVGTATQYGFYLQCDIIRQRRLG